MKYFIGKGFTKSERTIIYSWGVDVLKDLHNRNIYPDTKEGWFYLRCEDIIVPFIWMPEVLFNGQAAKSLSEAKRLIKQGAVSIEGVRINTNWVPWFNLFGVKDG